MNWADWVIVAIFLVSSLISLKRGFVREALSLAIWIFACVIAISFRDKLAVVLTPYIDTPSIRDLLAFAMLFVATLLLGAMVSYLLSALVRATGLSGTDRLLGMIFGFLRGFIVVMAILVFLPKLVAVDQDPWWQQSVFIPQLLGFEQWARAAGTELMAFISSLLGSKA